MKNEGLVVLERALGVLHFVATRTDASLAEISKGMNLGKSTVARLITCLEAAGLLARQPEAQRFYVGPRVLEYSFAARRGSSLIAAAHPHMVSLESEVGETVGLHVRVGDRRLCVHEVESHNPLRYVHGVGRPGPLNAGAIGKVILAFQPLDDQKAVLGRLQGLPVDSLVASGGRELEAELAAIKQRGYGLSRGEIVSGAISLAAPVFDRSGKLAGALSITGLDARIPEERVSSIATNLCDSARTISHSLGHGSIDLTS
ncbi:MAG: IclR family transcriptional regulator [Deltaproteobacteria bacterium]|nr:IclR family transcriptional regulator [Deltaproteobacteria bacterium]